MASEKIAHISHSKIEKLDFFLILISSVLLGIWAVKDTIALRNILLVLGATLGSIYLFRQLRDKSFRDRLTIANSLPLLMLGAMFVWVIFHYLFLSKYPEQQFQELTSTWLRAFLGVWLAIGTALAISKKPNLVNWLWVGIFVSFLVVLYQYIPRALAANSLYVPSNFESYIYRGKINAVLTGSIMISGLISTLMGCYFNRDNFLRALTPALYCFFGICLASYSYVYIFDARNGIGLEVLIYLWVLIFLIFKEPPNFHKIKTNIRRTGGFYVLALSLVALLVYFSLNQAKHNTSWQTLIEDVHIGIQVEKYPNWKDLSALGYPLSAPGRLVGPSTYERTAWGAAGIVIFAPENPLGIGILNHSFSRVLYEKYGRWVDDTIPSTHSAWVDLTLSYGFPGICLLLGSLLLILYSAVKKTRKRQLNIFSYLMAITLLFTYAVGEVATGHCLEILLYWIAFLATVKLSTHSF